MMRWLDSITDPMHMGLSELQAPVGEAPCATVRNSKHNSATELQQDRNTEGRRSEHSATAPSCEAQDDATGINTSGHSSDRVIREFKHGPVPTRRARGLH